jgi:hypothetical protein
MMTKLGAYVMVVLAQVPEVPPDMTPPGGDAARDIVGWIRGYALWILAGLFLAGAAIYGFGRSSSNAGAVTGGRSRMIAAVVGAIAVGLAIALINFAFDFGSSINVNN